MSACHRYLTVSQSLACTRANWAVDWSAWGQTSGSPLKAAQTQFSIISFSFTWLPHRSRKRHCWDTDRKDIEPTVDLYTALPGNDTTQRWFVTVVVVVVVVVRSGRLQRRRDDTIATIADGCVHILRKDEGGTPRIRPIFGTLSRIIRSFCHFSTLSLSVQRCRSRKNACWAITSRCCRSLSS